MNENNQERELQPNSSELENNSATQTPPAKTKSGRGFASMDPAMQREIASKGGKAAHQQGVAHQFTSEEAREAGRKGGEAVSRNREYMAQIGRKGGEASRGHRNNSNNSNNNNNPENNPQQE